VFDTVITEMSLSWPYTCVSARHCVTYSQELLTSGNNVSNHESGSQGVDDVLVVWVENQSVDDLACMSKM